MNMLPSAALFCNTGRKSGILFSGLVISVVLLFFIIPGCKKDKITQEKVSLPILWESTLPVEVYYCSPALSPDEKTVYIGTSAWLTGDHGTGNVFVALDAVTGKEKWKLQLGLNEVRSTPAIGPDNSLYFGVELRSSVNSLASGEELWHVTPGGNVLWKYNINPAGLTSQVGLSAPAIGSDGTIYIGGDKLYAITPGGTLKWTALSANDEALHNSPVIGEDGTLYFLYHNIPLTALDPADGSVLWTCPLGENDHCFASPAIGADGELYIATQPGLLYAVSPSGQIEWTFSLESAGFSGVFRSSPAVGSDGTIYFGINTGNPSSAFFAVNHDGTLKWKFEPSGLPDDVPDTHFDIYSSPALGTDSTVYFGQEFGRVYLLRTTDGAFAGMAETRGGITWSSPAIDSRGVLYIADLSGTVFAFQTTSKGLDPDAACPKYRYNNQNTGRKSGN
jgi:outer membrane protein assembly factor BamB